VYNIGSILQQLEKHWTARFVFHERRSQYWSVLITSRCVGGWHWRNLKLVCMLWPWTKSARLYVFTVLPA